jgi:hypothetical protein
MKILFVLLLFTNIIFSDTVKVYLYTPEINVNNFKALKASFDTYLGEHGNYELQPFSDKKTFEKYLKTKNSIVILSSWHYREIAKKYMACWNAAYKTSRYYGPYSDMLWKTT